MQKGSEIEFSSLAEKKLILFDSCGDLLLNDLLNVIFKNNTIKTLEVIFQIRLCALEVMGGCVYSTKTNLVMRSKPQDTGSFFDNETIFVSITSRSRVNLTTHTDTLTSVYKCLTLKDFKS